MEIVSLNVGLPRNVAYKGRSISTGIFKNPVQGPVFASKTNLAGDGQADLRVHGGPDKAIYAYPAEHYRYWCEALGRDDLAHGHFGENLTVRGLTEDNACIGDVLRVGDAIVQISQPRTPCLKLDVRMGITNFGKQFMQSLRTGFYLRVLTEGNVATGDSLTLIRSEAERFTVREVFALRHFDDPNRERLVRAARLASLAESWREALEARASA